MFYLHYAENGSILSVGNSVDNNLKHIVIDEKTFLDFNEGRKQTFEYKVIEDVKLNGKMHVVPTDIDFIDQLQHKKGKIKVFDMRNLYSPAEMRKDKINYFSIGR